MSLFFPSKSEKAFNKILADSPELELQYKNGTNVTISKLLKVSKDYITVLGFPGVIRQNQFIATVLNTRQRFLAEVVKTGSDNTGRIVFICKLPKNFLPSQEAKGQSFYIYPDGNVKMLINTNRGNRGLTMPVWRFGNYGLSMVNKSGIQFKVGTKIFQAVVTIGPFELLIDMQVVNNYQHELGKETLQILECNYRNFPEKLEQMVAESKKLQRPINKNPSSGSQPK